MREEIYSSSYWAHHFEKNSHERYIFSGHEKRELNHTQAEIIGASLQQFQLGEQSDGSNLTARAKFYSEKVGDQNLLHSINYFIKEEQKHGDLLGQFMRLNGIPELTKHWIDDAFRFLRKCAGLELMLSVLLMAEIVSLLYYRSLKNATSSKLLHNLCTHILRDEKHHFSFHSAYISKLRTNNRWFVRVGKNFFLRFLLLGTLCVVWKDHRHVLKSTYTNIWVFMHLAYASLEESITIINPSQTNATLKTQVEGTAS